MTRYRQNTASAVTAITPPVIPPRAIIPEAARAHSSIRIRPAMRLSADVAKVWASPVFLARGNRVTASPDRARSSTKASPMAHRASWVGIRAVQRARWAAK